VTVYDKIKATAPDKLGMTIKAKLARCIGSSNSMSKEDLSRAIFDKFTPTTDRQIRDAIADLVTADEPIVTNTETGGYFYANTAGEIQENIADLQSRINNLQRRVDGLRRASVKRFPGTPITAQGRLC